MSHYCLNLTEYDKIFSQIGRNITLIEEHYHTKLPYLRSLNDYLINHSGGTEFIMCKGRNIFTQIITEEFPKMGLYADKIYTDEELNQINQTSSSFRKVGTDNSLFRDTLIPKPHLDQY
jgi:hypothetical protein